MCDLIVGFLLGLLSTGIVSLATFYFKHKTVGIEMEKLTILFGEYWRSNQHEEAKVCLRQLFNLYAEYHRYNFDSSTTKDVLGKMAQIMANYSQCKHLDRTITDLIK